MWDRVPEIERSTNGRRWALGMWATALGVTCAPGSAAALDIAHSFIRRPAKVDPGTVHIFVYNNQNTSVRIASVALTGGTRPPTARGNLEALADAARTGREAEQPYLWWRVVPPEIAPGSFADVAIKLNDPPTHKLRVRLTDSDGASFEHTLTQVNEGLSLTFVGFSPQLDTIYAYVGNQLDTPVRLCRVRINGRDLTDKVRFLWDVIPAASKGCLVIPLPESLAPGAVVFLQVDGDRDQAHCAALVRAFSAFPITWLDGSLPEGLPESGDSAPPRRPGTVPDEGLAGFENIMRCPAHAHGPRALAAAEIIRRHAALLTNEPEIPGMVYVCRWEKEINYFAFSELADVVRVMPFTRSASYVKQPLRDRTQWLTALALRAAAPRPVHAVVPICFADSYQWTRSCTPQEVRALVYLPLSRGAKGLCYGKREPRLSSEAEMMLKQVTGEVASIRAYLQFADYVPLGTTDHPVVEAATLLAGDRALVAFLINHAHGEFDNANILTYTEQRAVRSTIMLPAKLQVESVRDVSHPDEAVPWNQAGPRLTIETDRLEIIQPYLITFRPAPALDGSGVKP